MKKSLKTLKTGGKRAVRADAEVAGRVCPECREALALGDLIVFLGYGRTGARHLRCVDLGPGSPTF